MIYPKYLPASDKEFNRIKILCMDVDGVLTDGSLYYGCDGVAFSKFNVLDGQGLKLVRELGVMTCFVTMSNTNSIKNRAVDLGIDYCLTDVKDKSSVINNILTSLDLSWSESIHIGDDINDIELLQRVGISIAVPNAVMEVLSMSNYVTKRAGGSGAVREVCDTLVRSRKINLS